MSQPASEELDALRQGAAFCAHDLRFVASATGADLLPWLERIASSPLADMTAGTVVSTTLMDGKGRMRADLRIIAPGEPADGLLLDLPTSHRAALLRLIDMYIIQDDVTIVDAGAEWRFVSVLGPRSGDVLTECMFDLPAPGELSRPHDDLVLLNSALTGRSGYDLLFRGDPGRDVVERLFAQGVVRVGVDALDLVRIEQGVPWFGPDLSVDVIPLEALLGDRVSVTKGCYPGQEVVARIQNLGQVARKLVRLSFDGPAELEAGAELTGTGDTASKRAGLLTSRAFDPVSGRTVALGYVRRPWWKSGDVVAVGDVQLTVTSLAGD